MDQLDGGTLESLEVYSHISNCTRLVYACLSYMVRVRVNLNMSRSRNIYIFIALPQPSYLFMRLPAGAVYGPLKMTGLIFTLRVVENGCQRLGLREGTRYPIDDGLDNLLGSMPCLPGFARQPFILGVNRASSSAEC